MMQTVLPLDIPKQYLPITNETIADVLEQVSDLLEAQEDDYYRIRAYREASEFARQCDNSLVEILKADGPAGLKKLPRIGHSIARSIEELAFTGKLSLLERMLADACPEDIFTTVPGIGQVLGRRIYRELGIETLEDLELAAYDGRLSRLPGFGRGRVKLIRAALESRLKQSARQRTQINRWQQEAPATKSHPSTELLLEVDTQYRYLAKVGQLRRITPRRFNPEGKRWLPVMQLNKGGWALNALYSNTARAHELNKTDDWVVVYYERDDQHGQCTIVTETRGDRRGQRVIRGQSIADSKAEYNKA